MSHIPQKLIRAGSTFEQKCSCGWAGLGHTAHEATEAIAEHIAEESRTITCPRCAGLGQTLTRNGLLTRKHVVEQGISCPDCGGFGKVTPEQYRLIMAVAPKGRRAR